MSPQETLIELVKDRRELLQHNRRYLAQGHCKQFRNATKFPVYQMHEVTTSTNNHYLLLNTFEDRAHVYQQNPMFEARAVVETGKGKAAVAIVSAPKAEHGLCVFYFMPHLFSRYRERMGLNIEGIELMRYMFKRNDDFLHHPKYRRKTMDDDSDVMLSCYDGAVFGYRHPQDRNSVVLMTFVANDTMQEGYKSRFNKEYNDEVAERRREISFLMPNVVMPPLKLRKQ